MLPRRTASWRARQFDAVVDWIAFTEADIERDLQLFRGRTRQFVFISSASAYQKPQTHYLITESTPLANPYWQYSRDKIACEERLMRAYREEQFPVTIVRPSLTYGETLIPLAVNSWQKSYTVVDRMLRGQKVIVPGDGSSLWVITHNSDFAKGLIGLLGNEQTIGHSFHITSDEVMTWDQYYRVVGHAAGVEPKLVHIASEFISACSPDQTGSLTGDKAVSVVFDNTKIKRFVPDFCAMSPRAGACRRGVRAGARPRFPGPRFPRLRCPRLRSPPWRRPPQWPAPARPWSAQTARSRQARAARGGPGGPRRSPLPPAARAPQRTHPGGQRRQPAAAQSASHHAATWPSSPSPPISPSGQAGDQEARSSNSVVAGSPCFAPKPSVTTRVTVPLVCW